ncbi:DMT family transporter [Methylonatrum kenyense]|uniref:DMT family transporter n=1 Tax=Methylonatrum kenyense TaxID=455253 RepID=UPI0020C0DE1E|nr:DMT family transporter [Methylonatrum kenyense]MCK8514771.1 DMT family transporter [Methylonatrum kenyense]
MSGKTARGAILLLVIGNLLAILSDIIVKAQGSDVPVLQFLFMRVLCTLAILLPFWPLLDHRGLGRGTAVHVARAHIGLVGVLCMVVALVHLPLATANALFYAAPLVILLLAVVLFRERVSVLGVTAVVLGFAGILLILRPLDFGWYSLSGLGAAAALALSALLVRKLPRSQNTMDVLFLTHVYALPAALLLMLWEGAPWDWRLLAAAMGSALMILGYSTTVILAYRDVAANRVTSAEYTGLIWAVLLGWLLFAEVPDAWFFAGATLIVVPLVLLGLSERQRRAPAGAPPPISHEPREESG